MHNGMCPGKTPTHSIEQNGGESGTHIETGNTASNGKSPDEVVTSYKVRH